MRILVAGMSVTQGFHDAELGGWVNRMHVYQIRKTLESDYEDDVTIFNLGISGDCTNRLLERFSVEAEARLRDSEDIVIFGIGVNDTQRYVETGEIKTPKEEFESNLEVLISKARQHTKNIVFVNIGPIVEEKVQPMPWADDRGHSEKDVAEYREVIENVCKKHNCLHISLKGVFGDNPGEVLPDGIHPNAEGHRLIFERVKEALEQGGLL